MTRRALRDILLHLIITLFLFGIPSRFICTIFQLKNSTANQKTIFSIFLTFHEKIRLSYKSSFYLIFSLTFTHLESSIYIYIYIYFYINNSIFIGYVFPRKLGLDEGITSWDLKHRIPRQKLPIWSYSQV